MSSAEDGDEGVFCSVLNVVIDYDMAEPTTLEPEEYDVQHSNKDDDTDVKNIKKIQQQVPVIRIFGPVLRENSINPPLQCKLWFVIKFHGNCPGTHFAFLRSCLLAHTRSIPLYDCKTQSCWTGWILEGVHKLGPH